MTQTEYKLRVGGKLRGIRAPDGKALALTVTLERFAYTHRLQWLLAIIAARVTEPECPCSMVSPQVWTLERTGQIGERHGEAMLTAHYPITTGLTMFLYSEGLLLCDYQGTVSIRVTKWRNIWHLGLNVDAMYDELLEAQRLYDNDNPETKQ